MTLVLDLFTLFQSTWSPEDLNKRTQFNIDLEALVTAAMLTATQRCVMDVCIWCARGDKTAPLSSASLHHYPTSRKDAQRCSARGIHARYIAITRAAQEAQAQVDNPVEEEKPCITASRG